MFKSFAGYHIILEGIDLMELQISQFAFLGTDLSRMKFTLFPRAQPHYVQSKTQAPGQLHDLSSMSQDHRSSLYLCKPIRAPLNLLLLNLFCQLHDIIIVPAQHINLMLKWWICTQHKCHCCCSTFLMNASAYIMVTSTYLFSCICSSPYCHGNLCPHQCISVI